MPLRRSPLILLACALLTMLPILAPSPTSLAQESSSGQATPSSLAGIAPRNLTEEQLAEFEAYIADMLELTGVPGAAVAVVQNGEVVYQQGFGVRALGADHPVTPETLMMIGSITKPMTATLAATLVDDLALTWDTPVVELLPEFTVADPELTQRLTVRNAFCACTGLPQRDPEFIFNSFTLTPERLITSVQAFPLTAPLGEAFQYSNQLFAIGGYAAAEAATNESQVDLYDAYVTAMEERLLDPLGMTRSTFALDRVFASGNYAQPHGQSLTGVYRPASLADDQRHVTAVAPAGALWSSVVDMARYVQMELAAGLAPDGTRVVSRENLEETWRTQVVIPAPDNPNVPQEFVDTAQGYGLGWALGEYRGQRLLWHSGGTFGYGSQLALLPDADLGLVILTNGINPELFKLAVQFRLFELAHGQPATFDPIIRTVIAGGAQQAAGLEQQLGPVDPTAIAPYLGRYTHEILGEVELTRHGDLLILNAGEFQAELKLLREAEGPGLTFLSSDLPLTGISTVTFEQDSGTPVMSFTDPTTGEAYAFTFVGVAEPAATPPN